MAVGRVLLTIPSQERVGCFPAMTILVIALFTLLFSFQYYLSQLSYSLTDKTYFISDILGSLQILALPSSLLYLFVVSQVRIRLNLKFFNGWTTVHFVLAIITICTAFIYILAFPGDCFGFVSSLFGDGSTLNFGSIGQKLQDKPNALMKFYQNPDNANKPAYHCLMYFASYAFFLQFFVAMIFASMASSLFGERSVLLAVRDVQNRFQVVVEQQKSQGQKIKPKKTKKINVDQTQV